MIQVILAIVIGLFSQLANGSSCEDTFIKELDGLVDGGGIVEQDNFINHYRLVFLIDSSLESFSPGVDIRVVLFDPSYEDPQIQMGEVITLAGKDLTPLTGKDNVLGQHVEAAVRHMYSQHGLIGDLKVYRHRSAENRMH